jgi:hypothetical protein
VRRGFRNRTAWQYFANISQESATLFRVRRGVKNASNWAIPGCIFGSAVPVAMSVAAMSRQIGMLQNIFTRPCTRSLRPMIRRKGGVGVTSTKLCSIFQAGRHRIWVRFPDFTEVLRCGSGQRASL